jgi:hypothetical protein
VTRGESGETVKSFDVTVSVEIRAWDQDGVTLYDWISDASDSDELYETIEEAAIAARQSLGG